MVWAWPMATSKLWHPHQTKIYIEGLQGQHALSMLGNTDSRLWIGLGIHSCLVLIAAELEHHPIYISTCKPVGREKT